MELNYWGPFLHRMALFRIRDGPVWYCVLVVYLWGMIGQCRSITVTSVSRCWEGVGPVTCILRGEGEFVYSYYVFVVYNVYLSNYNTTTSSISINTITVSIYTISLESLGIVVGQTTPLGHPYNLD